MSKCQSCGASVQLDAVQCQYCGTPPPRATGRPTEPNIEDVAQQMGKAHQLLGQMMDQMTPAPIRVLNKALFFLVPLVVVIVILMALFGR